MTSPNPNVPAVPTEAAHADPGISRLWSTPWAIVALMALFLAGSIGRAVSKPLWHDELFTFYLATRTTVAGLWSALASGVDLNPPLYYLSVKTASALVGPGALAMRLPAIVGFLTASVALYAVMRRRLDGRLALVAALVPSLTGAYMYAYEGRPYGLMLGFSAVALAAWQRRGEPESHRVAPVLCALMLAAATATHYYAVLTVLPVAAGELVRTLVRRRVDVTMVSALACAFLPLVFFGPLIRAARQFAPTFWARPAPGALIEWYRHLFDPLALLLAMSAGLTALVYAWWRQRSGPDIPMPGATAPSHARGLPIDEFVVALGLFVVPVAGYLTGVFVTGAFHERYVLHAVLGLAVLVAWSSAVLVRSSSGATILLGVLLLAFVARQAAGMVSLVRPAAEPAAEYESVITSVPGDRQLVVSHALSYLPMVHYSSAASRRRLTYLARPADVVRQLGGDTGSRALQRLALIVPLDVQDYDTFVRAHDHFYVYGPKSWLVPKLRSQGAELRLVREYGDETLFAVDVRGDHRP